MSLSPGARIGPYEVVGTLGAGGMGEVYQARDTKLNRSVALKILPVNAINYDAFPDGNRFVVLLTTTAKATAEPRTHLTMVFNLFDEIRRIAGKN